MRSYSSATAFRSSLEGWLKKCSVQSGIAPQRLQSKVAFERLLARVCNCQQDRFFLKGGYAMELRLSSARSTKDVDLACNPKAKDSSHSDPILEEIRQMARIDLGDYFSFEIGQAISDLEGPPYGGARYPVKAIVDGRVFVQFHLDVGVDVISMPVEQVEGEDWFSFCGLEKPTFRAISPEQHYAEKIHAYTLPRVYPNSRVKDLVDLILLEKIRPLDDFKLKAALTKTFKTRDTHDMPSELLWPPISWESPFAAMANECGLDLDLAQAFEEASRRYQSLRQSM